MNKILLSTIALAGTLAAAVPAQAGEYYSNNSSSSSSTTVINTTTNNNTVINNRYGGRNYNRHRGYYNYYGNYRTPAPTNQIQFRVPVRLNIFGSNIDLNIDSQNYPNYYRH